MRCEREENGGVTRWWDLRGWNIFAVAGAGCEGGLSVDGQVRKQDWNNVDVNKRKQEKWRNGE